MSNVLSELLTRAEADLAGIQSQKAALELKERTASERVAHLRALIDLDDLEAERPSADVARNLRVEDLAAQVLDSLGPTHYQDLWAEVARRGATLSSANPAAALLTRMSRDSRFVKTTTRGVYRIAKDGEPAPQPRRQKTRRRRKVAARKPAQA